ncbi:MAG: KH domain-containing protein [Clostridia bacterium]|nr:KH domain-containing protein [Clostridia bacterium]
MAKSYEASGKSVDEAIDAACALAGVGIEDVEIEILDLGGKGLFGFGQKDARVRVTVEEKQSKPAAQPASTFGPRKNKKELRQRKAPTAAEPEIRPIVIVEPTQGVKPCGTAARGDNRDRKEIADSRAHVGAEQRAERRPETRRESRATVIEAGAMAESIFADARAFVEPIFNYIGANPQYSTEIREGILWIILKGEKLGLLIGRRGETLNAIQYLINLAVNKRRPDHVRVVLDVDGYRESREQTLSALAHKMAEKAIKSGRRVELEPMNPHERRIVHIALQNDSRVETISHGEEPYRRVVVTARRSGKRGGRRNDRGRGGASPNSPAEQ